MWTLTIPSARRRVSHANRDLCVLRTIEGPRVSIVLATTVILVFSLVASLGKYRIQNPYPFILLIKRLQWYTGEMEKSDVRFHSSSHLSKQVSNSFTVTGRAGMAFIRY